MYIVPEDVYFTSYIFEYSFRIDNQIKIIFRFVELIIYVTGMNVFLIVLTCLLKL